MSYPMNEISDAARSPAEDPGTLPDSTSSVAGKPQDDARSALEVALGRGKRIQGVACGRAAKVAGSANGVIRDNPYQTMLIGIGVGALLGYLVAHRSTFDAG